MNRIALAAIAAGLIASVCVGCGSRDAGMRISALTLNDAPPTARMRAGYFTLSNPGAQPRRVVSVTSNAFGLAEIHRTETVDGVARMREISDLTIAAGETLQFEPFGRHVMLMRATSPKVPDDRVTITLCFDDQQCVTTTAANSP